VSSLDLVYPGKDTPNLVKDLSDDWIISGPIRAGVHLAGVWHRLQPKAFKYETPMSCSLNGHNVFAPVVVDHPWVNWAMECDENYSWLYFYAMDLTEEYKRRFSMDPYIITMLTVLEDLPGNLMEGEFTEPLFAAEVVFE
jgi:hypothetical protein